MTKSRMDTMSEVLEALADDGWTTSFEIDASGMVLADGSAWSAEEVNVEDTHRFEGSSNPGDEALLLAISVPDGRRGVLVLPYGPDLSGPQADAVRALSGPTVNPLAVKNQSGRPDRAAP